jgi:hypothetical protein
VHRLFEISSPKIAAKHLLIAGLMTFSAINSSAQLTLENLDYSRIPQKKIIELVESQKKLGHELFSDFFPKCFMEQDSSRYHKICTKYIIHGNLEAVWKEYLSIKPSLAYSGKIVGFGFLYSKDEDRILYKEDPFDEMKVGQLFFFNIKLLGGIRNLGTADEVTAIDDARKMIRFCYVENGKTEGTQEIYLKPTAEGYTEVTHETLYKSKSRFRDNMLYPYFHKRSVNEFHFAIRDIFEKDNLILSRNKCED